MNKFKRKAATIIAAKVRAMKNSNGELRNNAIFVLSKGSDIIASIDAVRNTLDKDINPSEMHTLVGSELHYEVSKVKAGDTFSFIPGGDENVATKDLVIANLKAIVPNGKARKVIESMADYTPTPVDDHIEDASVLDKEALTAEIKAATNVAQCKAIIEANEAFDDTTFTGTNANDLKAEMLTALEALPF